MQEIKENQKVPFVFFGTPDYAVIVLDELRNAGFVPSLIVTVPDAPKGRGLHLTPPPAKLWAEMHNIPIIQPNKLDSDFLDRLQTTDYGLGIVVAYGKIIPQSVIDLFPLGIINVHPSLLPYFRGSSPIESAILDGVSETGVTIMIIDAKMDHGPVLAQEKYPLEPNIKMSTLGPELFLRGGLLLAQILPDFIAHKINLTEQNHDLATFTKKILKEDGLINLNDSPEINYRKIRAYDRFPGAYFFATKNGEQIRVKIKDADLVDGNLIIKTVIPEGKKLMSYIDFENGFKNTS